jgi:hypothetical protein
MRRRRRSANGSWCGRFASHDFVLETRRWWWLTPWRPRRVWRCVLCDLEVREP